MVAEIVENGVEQEQPQAENALTMRYVYDQEKGRVDVEISGKLTTTIVERVNDKGDVEYTSEMFRAPQDDLKNALQWVAINSAKRALAAEWERQHPKPQGEGKARRSTGRTAALEAQLAAAAERAERIEREQAEQNARMEAMLAALMERMGTSAEESAPKRGSKDKGGR